MTYTRKRKSTKKPLRRPSYKKKRVARPTVKRIVQAALNRNIETKTSGIKKEDGAEIFHNNFINIDNEVLKTTQGTADPEILSTGNRIGDKINLRGVSLKFMFELNERYSDVTFRIMVVKSARGDVPTRASLFTGLCNNKMMDTFNKERYTIIASKLFKMTAPNKGNINSIESAGVGSGVVGQDSHVVTQSMSRATRIINMWIPGSKFARSGVIQYDNGGDQQKFFDYNVLCFAYSNWSTSQDIYYVGRLNTYIKQMYYKDA